MTDSGATPTSLTELEARDRAALLDVDRYDLGVDLRELADGERWLATSSVTFTCRRPGASTFVDIEAWGKQGETISKYCTKGRPLFVEGRLKLDQWEDKTSGQKRSKLKVVLEGFQFLGSGQREGGAGGGGGEFDQSAPSPERHAPPPRSAPKPGSTENLDEDVPF